MRAVRLQRRTLAVQNDGPGPNMKASLLSELTIRTAKKHLWSLGQSLDMIAQCKNDTKAGMMQSISFDDGNCNSD